MKSTRKKRPKVREDKLIDTDEINCNSNITITK